MPDLRITSPAFTEQSAIPAKYTCDGENINPPLVIDNIPAGTKSLALIMDDPDAPGSVFTHWLLYDLDPRQVKKIEENSSPAKEGQNDFGRTGYGGPCPPSGTHRYFFRLYALNRSLGMSSGLKRDELEKELQDNILASSELVGKYSR